MAQTTDPTLQQQHQAFLHELRGILAKAKVSPRRVVIGGSGVLGALGLRSAHDLDIHVPRQSAWRALAKTDGAHVGTAPSGSPVVSFQTPKGPIDFFTGPWQIGKRDFGKAAPRVVYSGIPHWSPQHTLAWKKAMGRPKDLPDIDTLKQHLKTSAALPSQEEIYQQVLPQLPAPMRRYLHHASGGLPDARGTSDVDISYYTRKPHDLLAHFPTGTKAERDDARTIYAIPGYARPVNLYATQDLRRAKRALKHRTTELALQAQYPELAAKAYELKRNGLGTEKAWAQVLGIQTDPYEALLDKHYALTLAQQKTAQYKLSRVSMTSFYKEGCDLALAQTRLMKLALGGPMNAEQNAPLSSSPNGALGGINSAPSQTTRMRIPPFDQAAAPQTPNLSLPAESPASAPGLKGVSSGR